MTENQRAEIDLVASLESVRPHGLSLEAMPDRMRRAARRLIRKGKAMSLGITGLTVVQLLDAKPERPGI